VEEETAAPWSQPMKTSTLAILFLLHCLLGGAALTGLEGGADGFFDRYLAPFLIFPFGHYDLPPIVSVPSNAICFVFVVWVVAKFVSQEKRDHG
jgi:hypothetical protein